VEYNSGNNKGNNFKIGQAHVAPGHFEITSMFTCWIVAHEVQRLVVSIKNFKLKKGLIFRTS